MDMAHHDSGKGKGQRSKGEFPRLEQRKTKLPYFVYCFIFLS
jgi:hypothetical protein